MAATQDTVLATREFTDRTDPIKAFHARFRKVLDESQSLLINYYGAGGVGKSALLEKIKKEFDAQQNDLPNAVCLYHNFNNGTDMQSILDNWKRDLQRHGCEFPFFETGEFVLSLKRGLNAKTLKRPKVKTFIEKNQLLEFVQGKVQNLFGHADNVIDESPFELIDLVKFLPYGSAVVSIMHIINDQLSKKEVDRRLNAHSDLYRKLNETYHSPNIADVEELLPELFAQDICDWANDSTRLIIFLDTYERVSSAMINFGELDEENRPHDWWIRDNANGRRGLLFLLPTTLWVIAGRNKLRWQGEADAALEQHLIKALSEDDAHYFLTRAGVWSRELRDRIYRLTEGYPLYLDLCVDIYEQYIQRYEKVPTRDDFGQALDQIVRRLLKYMDYDARSMVQCLSLLGTWTNDMARHLITDFNHNLYNEVKRFSFIQRSTVELNGKQREIFQFDRTVQKFLLASLKADENFSMLFEEMLEASDEYFDRLFNTLEDQQTAIYCLKLRAELVARLVSNADELKRRFDEYFRYSFNVLIELGMFSAAEEIIDAFFNAVVDDGIIRAHFELLMGNLRSAQGNYREALALNRSAYEKYKAEFGDENKQTLTALNNVSNSLFELGQYDQASKMFGRVLELSEELLGDDDDLTLTAMSNLAICLDNLGFPDDAFELHRRVYDRRVELFGEDDPETINALSNVATALSDQYRFAEAMALERKVLDGHIQMFGIDHLETLSAMSKLAATLREVGSIRQMDDNATEEQLSEATEQLNEALELSEYAFEGYQRVLGDEHPRTLNAMKNLARLLHMLDRKEEALKLFEQVLDRYKEAFGEEHPDTLSAMNDLSSSLKDLGRKEEALSILERAIELYKKTLGENHPDTLKAEDDLVMLLSDLERYEEALALAEDLIERCKIVFGEDGIDTLMCMFMLPLLLMETGRLEEAEAMVEDVSIMMDRCEERFDKDNPLD